MGKAISIRDPECPTNLQIESFVKATVLAMTGGEPLVGIFRDIDRDCINVAIANSFPASSSVRVQAEILPFDRSDGSWQLDALIEKYIDGLLPDSLRSVKTPIGVEHSLDTIEIGAFIQEEKYG